MLRVAEQHAATDTGRQRPANEDALFVRTPLFVVADGMGGAQAGEVASRTAVDAFREGLGDDAWRDPEGSLTARALEANARIHELSQSNPKQAGMGTTLTAVYVGEQDVSIAHVGDSRVYCLRDGELERLTDDHSLVDELMRQGKLTPEEAEEHPQRSIITRALGPEPTVEVDTRSYRGRARDVYLLCSDGLTTMLQESQIRELLIGHDRLRDAAETLLRAANEAGGRDNITVVLFRLEEVDGAAELGLTAHHTLTNFASQDTELAAGAASERGVVGVVRRAPRRPPAQRPLARRTVWRRRLRVPLALLIVLGVLAAGAYLAIQSVYFIATNQRGLVTIYSGLPYTLPGKLNLYSQHYVSGVPASTIPPTRRRSLLNHSLRSESNAAQLVRSLEQGQLER
ncbi:MAG TPA: Stp1/IreP family PP2C-type Ser/Thr phosphatase [Solirubrobacteraceae bacterium]